MRSTLLLLCLLAAACGTTAAPAKDYPSTKTVFGGSRPVTLRVPKRYDKTKASPLIVLLHGYGADGASQTLYFGFDSLVDEADVFVAAPDGTINDGGQHFWNSIDYRFEFDTRGVDDDGYITGLIQEISAEYHIDAKRVFLAGHSNGGFMSYHVACRHSELVAAMVSLAGATWLDASKCAPSEPVSVLQIHGTGDTTILYDGKVPTETSGGYRGAVADVEQWAIYNRCTGTLGPKGETFNIGGEFNPSLTTAQRFGGCPSSGAVELWTIDNGAHIPPLGEEFRAQVWAWLSAHPKP
jgi:polyhydroxybutyrate depolymerase